MRLTIATLALLLTVTAAPAAELLLFSDPSGLSAEAEFDLLDPVTLQVRLKNTSTGVPDGFLAADQLLTGISWDFGEMGMGSDTSIAGGSVVIGPDSASMNFDQIAVQLGAGADVSGEFGYGNGGGSGALPNFVSGNGAQATPFGGPNLDGPDDLNGPQAGLIADPALVGLGGLGAISDEWIATLTLTEPIGDLSFLYANTVRVEFGSDAAFIDTPEPATALLLMMGLPLLRRKRS